jgi:hypothetical protein
MGLVEHIQNALEPLLMNGIDPRKARICIATATRTITMFIMDFLKGFDIATQNTIMEKVLSHDLIIAMLPFYLHDVKRLKHNQQLFDNFCYGSISHVIGHKSFNLVLAKDIICTFVASSQSLVSNKEATKVLGMDRRNVKHGIVRRVLASGNTITCDYHLQLVFNYKRYLQLNGL